MEKGRITFYYTLGGGKKRDFADIFWGKAFKAKRRKLEKGGGESGKAITLKSKERAGEQKSIHYDEL